MTMWQQATTSTRLTKVITWGLLLVALGCWWRTLAPTSVGGPVGHIVVSGTSMQPLLHTGDLVLTRHQSSYSVGDLVVARVDGSYVIHRLHDGNAVSGWHTKGDNRQSVDSWVLHPRDIVGKQWLTVRGYSRGTAFMRSPLALPVELALLMFALLLPSRRRRNARLTAALETRTHTPRRRGRPALELAGFVGAFLCTGVSVLAFFSGLRSGSWLTPLAAVVSGASATVYLAARIFRGRGCAEPRRTFARLGNRVVDVIELPYDDVAVRTCDTADELVRIADRRKLPIVHQELQGSHRFVVLAERETVELVI